MQTQTTVLLLALCVAVPLTVETDLWNVPTLTRYQKNMMPTAEHLARYRSPAASYLCAVSART